jgi:hypothetical protein
MNKSNAFSKTASYSKGLDSEKNKLNTHSTLSSLRVSSLTPLAKSLLGAILITAATAAIGYGLSTYLAAPKDTVSTKAREARLSLFNSLGTVPLVAVSAADTERAIQSMHLSIDAVQALKADLHAPTQPPAVKLPDAPPIVRTATANSSPRVRLVWITLWDTDVEDGDVVRIESDGYARSIKLTKRGDTFALPAPASGLVKVTGVEDGDGGGITVGLASGDIKAVFPIMSAGQTLGLRVKVN